MKAIEKKFEEMGARVRVGPFSRHMQDTGLAIDISRDQYGEFFDITTNGKVDISVVDVDKKDRHLLLHADDGERKDKFLCGHDERHWFVCAVPGQSVSNVRTAKEALKPAGIRESQDHKKIKTKNRNRRRNKSFIRQGEWFFEPAPDVNPKKGITLKNEPLSRGAGKPHMCEELYRRGGTTVYVSHLHPTGLTQFSYDALIKRDPMAKKLNWQVMSRDPEAFVRGKVKHSDHATINLQGWHRVWSNTENEAPAAKNVVFLD